MRHLRQLFLVFLAPLAAASASAEVPDQAWGKGILGQEAPMWVSEDLAVVDGQLQKQHFHPDILPLVEREIKVLRSRNATGCEVYSETAPPRARAGARTRLPFDSIKGTTAAGIRANSAQLVSGTITDLKQGFLSGQTRTMAEVAVDSGAHQLGAQRLYVVVGVADIRVEGTHLCRSDGRPAPSVGASIVLALDTELAEERILGRTETGEPIISTRPNEVLISDALPKAYKDFAIDVDALRAQLRGRASANVSKSGARCASAPTSITTSSTQDSAS